MDTLIDGHKIKNRSHAVELLLMKAMGDDHPNTAIILAGGKGIRLNASSPEIPKALLPVHEKPIIGHLIDLLKRYQVKNIFVAVGQKKEKIKEYLGQGEGMGVAVKYLEEESPLGTGGAVRQAEHIVDRDFIVANSDELKNIDIQEMYRFHKEKQAIATVALTTLSEPHGFGVVTLSGSKILEFTEKPKKGSHSSNLINAGLYIFSPEIFEYIPKGPCSLEKDVFPLIAQKGRLLGYPFSGQWFETSTPERYEKAAKGWTDIK